MASRSAGAIPTGQKISEASAHQSFSFAALTIATTMPTKPKAPAPKKTAFSTESASVTQELNPTISAPARQAAMIIASIDLRPSCDQ